MPINPINAPKSNRVNTNGEYLLFVEGEKNSDKSIDPIILEKLFEKDGSIGIAIAPLKSSNHIQSAAESLSDHFDKYYFLIDKDYIDEERVDETWSNFLSDKKNNLLIWKRRAIENYFIDPDYLKHSAYIDISKMDILKEKILNCANQYLLMDIANYVIISINKKIESARIKIFEKPEEKFSDVGSSIESLKGKIKYKKPANAIEKSISDDEIERLFDEFHNRMTNKKDKVELGKGEWINLINGKPIFNAIISHSGCFQVPEEHKVGNFGARDAILKDLVRQDDKHLPKDFIKLRELINNAIK